MSGKIKTDGDVSLDELTILRILWNAERPLQAREIHWRLIEEPGRGQTSGELVWYFLDRLNVKGLVECAGMARYSPKVTREGYYSMAGQTLADKLYDGSLNNLLASMARHGLLSVSDISVPARVKSLPQSRREAMRRIWQSSNVSPETGDDCCYLEGRQSFGQNTVTRIWRETAINDD